MSSSLTHYDYGFRIYNPAIGRFLSVDPLTGSYPMLTPYQFASNSPIAGIDLDGLEFYFAAGAGNDPGNTGYIDMMLNAFELEGIKNVRPVEANGSRTSDILFTIGDDSKYPANRSVLKPTKFSKDEFGVAFPTEYEQIRAPINWRISEVVREIGEDLLDNPVEEGSQFNLVGYSTGSVIMAQAALQFANEGKVVNNLVLIGTPILPDSELGKELSTNINIQNIHIIDIEGDNIKDLRGFNSLSSLYKFIIKGDSHPHFKYAFNRDAKINSRELAKELIKNGVE